MTINVMKDLIVSYFPILLATGHINNMLATIQDARRRRRPAMRKLEKAFGKNANINVIEQRIQNMQNTPLRVHTADPAVIDGMLGPQTNAVVHPAHNDDAFVGSGFYGAGMDRTLRAHTLIHEAAHQQFRAGDDIDRTANRVVRYRETPPAGHKIDTQAGCKFYSKIPFFGESLICLDEFCCADSFYRRRKYAENRSTG
jgi:hypothetical protein